MHTSYSQLGQDEWVLQHSDGPGYYMELGAHHPEQGSNTKLLEEHGWRGLSVDPFPMGDWSTRRNPVVKHAIASSAFPRPFVRAGELGGFAGMQAEHLHRQFPEKFANASVEMVEPLPPEALLSLYDVPRTIDYLSIDVEGAEVDILKSFPFDRYTVKLISVEHNFTENRDTIHTILKSNGFVRDKQVAWDDFYVLTPRT